MTFLDWLAESAVVVAMRVYDAARRATLKKTYDAGRARIEKARKK